MMSQPCPNVASNHKEKFYKGNIRTYVRILSVVQPRAVSVLQGTTARPVKGREGEREPLQRAMLIILQASIGQKVKKRLTLSSHRSSEPKWLI